MTLIPIYDEVHFETAEELLAALSPHDVSHGEHLWKRGDREGWMFRGQSESVWNLVPSAFRARAFLPFIPGQLADLQLSPLERVRYEMGHARQFASRASHHGFEIPGDSQELRGPVTAPSIDQLAIDFPPINERGLYALAQHYGIPTRLLDWSANALAAAYFASVGPAKRATLGDPAPKESDGNLAVWALQRGLVTHTLSKLEPGAVIVSAPGFSIPNLRAQAGVFTLVRVTTPLFVDKELPTLDALIRGDAMLEHVRSSPLNYVGAPLLFKFTLPHPQARRLLYFLNLSEIHVASLFPNLQSVRDHMAERCFHVQTTPGEK